MFSHAVLRRVHCPFRSTSSRAPGFSRTKQFARLQGSESDRIQLCRGMRDRSSAGELSGTALRGRNSRPFSSPYEGQVGCQAARAHRCCRNHTASDLKHPMNIAFTKGDIPGNKEHTSLSETQSCGFQLGMNGASILLPVRRLVTHQGLFLLLPGFS